MRKFYNSLIVSKSFVLFTFIWLLSITSSHSIDTGTYNIANAPYTCDLSFNTITQTLTITFTDASQPAYMAIGFGNTIMSGTYAILVEDLGGGAYVVQERTLGNHNYGSAIANQEAIIDTQDYANGIVTVTRSFSSMNGYDFAVGDSNVDYIVAKGSTVASYHGGGNRAFGTLSLEAPTITWDGSVSTDWSTAGNWDGNIVPTNTDDVVIADVTNDPVIATDVETNTLDLESGAVLSVNSGSLSVNGELILNGSLSVASGASLLPLGTVSGSGSATINRNTTFGVSDGQYSAIGSPITSGSTSDLGSIVYSYDETIAYGANGNNRFVSVASPETISQGDAYFSANTGNISFVGTPNGGDENITLIYDETNDGGATNAGFNLVSNPYPAAIYYDDFINGTTNLDVDGTLYFWDDGGSDLGQRDNNDYITATGIGAASGGDSRSGDWDGYIRSAQGFFVKATTAGTLSFTPSMMSTGNNTDGGFFREAKPETVRLALTSSKLYNDILIGFTEDATTGFDRTLDGYKIKGNTSLQLYSKMGTASMAIQALPILTEEVTIPLGFDISQAGTYKFELPETLTYGFETYLLDHKLDKMINLSEGSYSFETQSVNDSDRFSLVFSPNKILSIDNATLDNNKLVVFSGSDLLYIRLDHVLNDATIKVYDLSGTLVKQIEHVDFNGQDIQTGFDREGLYIVTVQTNDQLLVKKFIR